MFSFKKRFIYRGDNVDEESIKQLWEKQKMVSLYAANGRLEEVLSPYVVPEITRVVDIITGRTALVHKILPKFGVQVWVKERGQERENWPWGKVTVRQPRLLKRYPRPFRWPREEPSKQCHCRIGLMEVENVEERTVRCKRCKQLIGSESYPRRIERAADALRKADREPKPKSKVRKRILARSKRKTVRRNKVSVKARKRTQGRRARSVVVRPKRRSNAKTGNRKTRKGAAVPKNTKIPKGKDALSKIAGPGPTEAPSLAEGTKAS